MKVSPEFEKWSWVAGIFSAIFGFVVWILPSHHADDSQPTVQPVTLEIQGRWDSKKASQIAVGSLEHADWSKTGMDGPLVHKAIGEYHLIYKNGESIVVALTTNPQDFECHACAPYLSFFEFEKVEKGQGWHLIGADIGVIEAGSWGKAPTMSVRVIADGRYGIFLEPGYTAQGWTSGQLMIYARMGDVYQNLFSILADQSDPNGRGWSSEVSLVPSGTGFYDMVITRKGHPGPTNMRYFDGVNDDQRKYEVAEMNGSIRPRQTYRFDGQRYAPLDRY